MNIMILLLLLIVTTINLFPVYLIPYITITGTVLLCAVGLFVILFIALYSVYRWYRDRKSSRLRIAFPIICLLFLLFARKTYLVERLDFRINRERREEVVELIRNSDEQLLKNGLFQLPAPYCGNIISQSNEVGLYQTKQQEIIPCFYYFRGILDASSGFIYSEDPFNSNEFDMQPIINFGNGWYFCRTY